MRACLRARLALLVLACALVTLVPSGGREVDAQAVAAIPAVAREPRFGIAHVAYGSPDPAMAGDLASRYAQATAAGAAWNRWALYWSDVETAPGYYDYRWTDATVAADRQHGLQTNAVLMNTPRYYWTGGTAGVQAEAPPPRLGDKSALSAYLQGAARTLDAGDSPYTYPPQGLYNPTFSDGTDAPGAGKSPNASNPWARFVYTTVSRYRGQVGLWEMWNEPDFSRFWRGSVADYVRLLKVGYLAAKSADPGAKVAVGGQAYWEWVQNHAGRPWLQDFLTVLRDDPQRAANGYYFDVVPWHWYNRASDVFYKTADARSMLAQYGIYGKEIWVNESNVPVCGEPPPANPVPCDRNNWFANAQEQAAFVIQATAYALAADVREYLVFQLYDDGNEFAYGIHRNDGSARPAYTALQVAAKYLGGATGATRSSVGEYEKVVVRTLRDCVAGTSVVVWKRTPGDGWLTLPGSGTATLVSPDGSTSTISASGGSFAIWLSGATARNGSDYFIGGSPRILVLGAGATVQSDSAALSASAVAAASPLLNGGFEAVTAGSSCPDGWACGGTVPATISVSPDPVYEGSRAAWLGHGYWIDPTVGGNSSSTVSQAMTVPASGASLSFAYRLDAPAEQAGNTFRVQVLDADAGYRTDDVFVRSAPTNGWQVESAIDLGAYAGHSVTLIFRVEQASADTSIAVYLDAVQVATARQNTLHFPVVMMSNPSCP